MLTMQSIATALRAQAVCDAVGDPFEFGDPSFCEVQKYVDADAEISITDDTQMTLFGLEALIECRARYSRYSTELAASYLRVGYSWWFSAQTGERVVEWLPYESRLFMYPAMRKQRHPGGTVMRSLRQQVETGTRKANDRNGCGGVMRLLTIAAAPLLWRGVGVWEQKQLAYMDTRITHGGTEAFAASQLWVAAALELVTSNESLEPDGPRDRLGRASRQLVKLATKIEQLGQGWTGLECLKMACWALHVADGSFSQLLVLSIAHGGDSDSVGAVAGALWGLYWGSRTSFAKEVPERLVRRVSERDIIESVLSRLTEAVQDVRFPVQENSAV